MSSAGESCTTTTTPSRRQLWSIPSWRYAFPASVVSRLGDFVFDTTVVLWIGTEIGRGEPWAPVAVSGVMIAAALPVLFVGPLAGVFVDRLDRHRILVLSNLVQAAAMASLLLVGPLGSALGTGGQLGWIYAAIAIANGAGQFFVAARTTMIAKTIPDELRTMAFSMQGSANTLSAIIGPPLAAPLLFSAGVNWALALNAGSFLLSSWLLGRAPWDSQPDGSAAGQRFWSSLRSGLSAIGSNTMLVCIAVSITVVAAGTGAINVLEVFFVTDVLHRNGALLGILMMAFSIGTLLGVLTAPWIERRVNAASLYVLGLIVVGLLVVLFSRTTTFGVSLVVYTLLALPVGIINTVLFPLFMQSIPRALLGRASAVLNIGPTIASLVTMAGTGWLLSTVLAGVDAHIAGMHFGPVDTVFTVAGLLILLTGLVVAKPITSRVRTPAPAVGGSSLDSRGDPAGSPIATVGR